MSKNPKRLTAASVVTNRLLQARLDRLESSMRLLLGAMESMGQHIKGATTKTESERYNTATAKMPKGGSSEGCSQCGKPWEHLACGPTHAAKWAQIISKYRAAKIRMKKA